MRSAPQDKNAPMHEAEQLARDLKELSVIRSGMVAFAATSLEDPDAIQPTFRASARNLLHYLALRRKDLRPLQLRLAELGLSSLGRAESHVLATVDAVLRALAVLARTPCPASKPTSIQSISLAPVVKPGQRYCVPRKTASMKSAIPKRFQIRNVLPKRNPWPPDPGIGFIASEARPHAAATTSDSPRGRCSAAEARLRPRAAW